MRSGSRRCRARMQRFGIMPGQLQSSRCGRHRQLRCTAMTDEDSLATVLVTLHQLDHILQLGVHTKHGFI